jgi:hypothetical protein
MVSFLAIFGDREKNQPSFSARSLQVKKFTLEILDSAVKGLYGHTISISTNSISINL